MSTAVAPRLWTEPEYLAFERGSEVEHELLDGEILTTLNNAFGDERCEAHGSDMKVRVPDGAGTLITYPDVSALCGEPELLDDSRDVLLNPQVIFEVLSKSSESYDRGEKFRRYRLIPSLQDYLLVSQKEAFVEHDTRQADATWNLRELGRGDPIRLPVLDCELALDDVYRRLLPAAD